MPGWMAFEGTDDFSRLTEYNPNFRADARRFEMITLPFQDFYGFTQSVELLLEIGIAGIAEVTRSLHEPLLRWEIGRASCRESGEGGGGGGALAEEAEVAGG